MVPWGQHAYLRWLRPFHNRLVNAQTAKITDETFWSSRYRYLVTYKVEHNQILQRYYCSLLVSGYYKILLLLLNGTNVQVTSHYYFYYHYYIYYNTPTPRTAWTTVY